MQQHPKSVGMSPILQGHVFERLVRFAGLPTDVQEDTKHFQEHVIQNKQMLFENNKHALVKSVYSVKGEALVNAIMQWLQARMPQPVQGAHSTTAAMASDEAWEVPNGTTPAQRAEAAVQHTPASSDAQGDGHVSCEPLVRAKQIAEALVLSGFLTPYKDDATHTMRLNTPAPDHYVREGELLIPVAKGVTELQTTSVWSVIDGATYARSLKRKAGVLGQITQGKDVYVVMNERTKKAYLFESDVARESIAEIRGDSVNVQFDHDHFEFGVRVAPNSVDSKDKPELFNATTKHLQEELVNAWLTIGAKYHESNIKSMVEADAKGLVGPDASRNAEQKLASERQGAPTADVTSAALSGTIPVPKTHNAPADTGNTTGTAAAPSQHQQEQPFAAQAIGGPSKVQDHHTAEHATPTAAP